MSNLHNKHCRVCGDKAIGFNFNVVTCESCKLFFRRHALQQNFLLCLNDKKCIIDKSNRNDCKQCRMAKCLAIGMKKDLISSRIRGDSSSNQSQVFTFERIFKNSIELKSAEYSQLTLVRNATSFYPVANDLPTSGDATSLPEAANLVGHTVRCVIKFCKTFTAFTNLDQNDQIMILKHFHPEQSSIHASFCYDADRNAILIVDNEGKVMFAELRLIREWGSNEGLANFGERFQKFLHLFQMEMENDSTIRDLILVIFLFRPRPNVAFSENIRYQHILYHYLLKRYLEHKYGNTTKARDKYASILVWLRKIEFVADSIRGVYGDIQNNQDNLLDQVMTEIYCS